MPRTVPIRQDIIGIVSTENLLSSTSKCNTSSKIEVYEIHLDEMLK